MTEPRKIKDGFVDYTTATPDERTELFRQNPEATRQTLEQILREDPDLFRGLVPQGIDPQTGLYTKEYFEKIFLPKRIEEARQEAVPLTYVLIDIDNLRNINNASGYQAGDDVIRSLTETIRTKFRLYKKGQKDSMPQVERRSAAISGAPQKPDLIVQLQEADSGRVGYGDEFGIVLYNTTAEQAKTAMERIRGIINRDNKSRSVPYTVSIGIVQYQEGLNPQDMIVLAGREIANAKATKDTIKVYEKRATPPSPSG